MKDIATHDIVKVIAIQTIGTLGSPLLATGAVALLPVTAPVGLAVGICGLSLAGSMASIIKSFEWLEPHADDVVRRKTVYTVNESGKEKTLERRQKEGAPEREIFVQTGSQPDPSSEHEFGYDRRR